MPASVNITYQNMIDPDQGLIRYLSVVIKSMVIEHDYDALQKLIDDIQKLDEDLWSLMEEIEQFRKEYEAKIERKRQIEEQLAKARQEMNAIDDEIQNRFISQIAGKNPGATAAETVAAVLGEYPARAASQAAAPALGAVDDVSSLASDAEVDMSDLDGLAALSDLGNDEPATPSRNVFFDNFEVVGGGADDEDEEMGDLDDLDDLADLDEIGIESPMDKPSGYIPLETFTNMALGGTALDDEPEEEETPSFSMEPSPDSIFGPMITDFDDSGFEDDDADSPEDIDGGQYADIFGAFDAPQRPLGGPLDFDQPQQPFGGSPFDEPPQGHVPVPPSFAALDDEFDDDEFSPSGFGNGGFSGGGGFNMLGDYDESQFEDDYGDISDEEYFS